jgi:hypothetical protein
MKIGEGKQNFPHSNAGQTVGVTNTLRTPHYFIQPFDLAQKLIIFGPMFMRKKSFFGWKTQRYNLHV